MPDRIDESVAPGSTVNPVDNSFDNPELKPSARRRTASWTGRPDPPEVSGDRGC
jgi:hypothetical protein